MDADVTLGGIGLMTVLPRVELVNVLVFSKHCTQRMRSQWSTMPLIVFTRDNNDMMSWSKLSSKARSLADIGLDITEVANGSIRHSDSG